MSGWVHPTEHGVSPEARRLLDLRYLLSAVVADEYAEAGFAVVVQDNIFGPDVVTWLRSVRRRPRRLVVLRPSTAAVVERDAARQKSLGKVAYRPGEFTVAGLDAILAETPQIGLWLDTSFQTPEETAEDIWVRAADSLVTDDQLSSLTG